MGHKKLVKFESQILPTAQRRGVSNNRSSDDPDIITRCAHVEGFFDALHAPLIALTDANGVYNDFILDQQSQISPVTIIGTELAQFHSLNQLMWVLSTMKKTALHDIIETTV